MNQDSKFAQRVFEIVGSIPEGRVMTYGQIAGLCGNAKASRVVGGIAHYGPSELPWHRVVNRRGGLASGYHGGKLNQKSHLEAEGISVIETQNDFIVDLNKIIWSPDDKN